MVFKTYFDSEEFTKRVKNLEMLLFLFWRHRATPHSLFKYQIVESFFPVIISFLWSYLPMLAEKLHIFFHVSDNKEEKQHQVGEKKNRTKCLVLNKVN